MTPMGMISGAAMDLGLNATSETESEAEKARKKKLQMQQQRQTMASPFGGAASSLLSNSGNQY